MKHNSPHTEYCSVKEDDYHKHQDKNVHNKTKECRTDICRYSNKTKASKMKQDKYEHNIEKNFMCNFCHHRTSIKNDLDEHIASLHDKEKYFGCEYCDCYTRDQLKHFKKSFAMS